jgi:hypothetical protein
MRRWWILAIVAVVIAIAIVWFGVYSVGEHPHRAIEPTAASTSSPGHRGSSAGVGSVRHLAGRVMLDGKPAAATVRVATDDDGFDARAEAGADGHFALDVPAGNYWLRAFSAGVIGPGQHVDVRDGDRTDIVLVVHACTRELVGRVTDSSGGAPIDGAQIDGMVATNKAGQFALCDMNAQTEITAVAAGFASAVRHLMPGQIDVDFALVPEAALSGTVIGPDRAPIADARVRVMPSLRTNRGLMRTRNVGAGATTDDTGAFSFHGLGAGAYDVVAVAHGFVLDAALTVNVALTTAPIVIALRPADTIRGVAHSAGKPIANAELTWMPDAGGIAETTTHADGSFEFADVRFGKGTFASRHYQPVRNITTGPAPLQLELAPALEIRGRVVHAGAPVAGAEITGMGPNAISGDDGSFVWQVIAPGPATLVAQSEVLGGFSAPKTIEVTDHSVDGVELDIAFSASVSGIVVDQAGAPIARAAIKLDNNDMNDEGTATTHDDGTFRVAMLSGGRGSYAVTVTVDGHALPPIGPAVTIAVPDATSAITGMRVAVTLVHAKLAGHVVDDRGAAIPDASIESRGIAARSDADGAFSIDVAAARSYKLRVAGPPGMTATVDVAPDTDARIVLHDPGSVNVTCESGEVELYTASSTTFEHVACGATVADVPAGEVTAVTRDDALGQAIVQSGKTVELAVGKHATRDVAVRVTRASAPVPGATCLANYSMGDFFAGDTPRGETDATGSVVLTIAALKSRVWCEGPTSSASVVVDPSADRATIALP